MYSKNDYRYYLEHRLEESDDYLAHYGVKGMKWRKHKVNRTDGTDWIRSAYDPKHSVGGIHGLENLARHLPHAARSEAEYVKEQRKPINRLKRAIRPKRKKIEVISFKDQRTGKEYKQQKPSKPKVRKSARVTVVTDSKRKRSKKEAKWNKEMQSYGKEYLASQNKKKRRR